MLHQFFFDSLRSAQMSGIFHPPLPLPKLKAIDGIYPGSYKKVILTFDSVFWPTTQPFISLARITHPSKTKMENKPLNIGDKLFLENFHAQYEFNGKKKEGEGGAAKVCASERATTNLKDT